jgi:hypothetical protein
MGAVFTCSCGMKTTSPFLINGEKLCTMCAESVAPRIVSSRAAHNWEEFTSTKRRMAHLPRSRYARSRDE